MRALRTPRGGAIPSRPTSLIGRERELDACLRLLTAEVRLLTLTGPPGIGKTRLALEVAAVLSERLAGGAVFADLSPVSEPALVPPAIARALGVTVTVGQDVLDRLAESVRSRTLLLVLDNFEQVLPAADYVATLIDLAPDLRVLATSRESLRLAWEHQITLGPLAVPKAGRLTDVRALHRYPAVALFVARSRAVEPEFALTAQNAASVVEICRRLDGLPLAIELAAARTKVLTPRAISGRLQHRLDLLSHTARDVTPRHHTLRAAIGWSYALLEPEERSLFRRLGVFVGGFSLEAAETLCGGPLLDAVGLLVDKSLVQPDGTADPRFRMLATIREFALEQLEMSGEVEDMQRAHAEVFLHLAERAEPHLSGPDQTHWLNVIDRDFENFRAALRWSSDHRQPETAQRLAGALWPFLFVRGSMEEAGAWYDDALQSGETSPAVRAKFLRPAGLMAMYRGQYDVAASRLAGSLALWREIGDTAGILGALNSLGSLAFRSGNPSRAADVYRESLALARATGNPGAEALALTGLGNSAMERDLDAAVAYFEESLSLARRVGNSTRASIALCNLGFVMLRKGDYASAAAHFSESLLIRRDLGSWTTYIFSLVGLAEIARLDGDMDRATRLSAAVAEVLAAGEFIDAYERSVHAATIARLRETMGTEAFASAWAAGQAMTIEQAAEYALAAPPSPPPAPPAPLSPREREVAALLAQGLSNREIAAMLGITAKTAAHHVQHILDKLQLRSRAQVAAWAVEHSLQSAPRS